MYLNKVRQAERILLKARDIALEIGDELDCTFMERAITETIDMFCHDTLNDFFNVRKTKHLIFII